VSDNRFGEKTEQPTPHRLREARRKGQVVKSTELCSACNLLAVVFLFILFGGTLFQWIREMVGQFLGEYLSMAVSDGNMRPLIMQVGFSYFKIMGLIFVTVLSAGLIINYAQVGFVFSTDKISPSMEKLNPLEGFKRIVSRRALFELLKALMKICLVGMVTFIFFSSRLEGFLTYMFLSPGSFLEIFSSEIINLSLRVAIIFIILAVLDYIYQRQEHFKNLRMTRQEVKEEFKQMEGDPLIRSKLREKQRSLANQRMMHEVPNATVVVTNPTELAVALKYSAEKIPVPLMVAKGAGLIAARIKEKAKEHNVPVVENKPVARMLYEQVEIGQVIPMELYQSVAEILALVYELNKEHGRRR
jgi:flagellar biosynthetic protein FlhB